MEFNNAFETIAPVLKKFGSDLDQNDYDGLIVKRLEPSNTLDKGRTTKQSHIAITGPQMDMFPYVRADGYFEVEYEDEDPELKKYFVAQIPVFLHRENVEYLDPEAEIFTEKERLVHVSIVRSRRKNAADQIQMSMTYMDSPEYVKYRRIVHAGSYMIMLKRNSVLKYDIYCVKQEDAENGEFNLKALNNIFCKKATNTVVKLDEIEVSELPPTPLDEYLSLDLDGRKQAFITWMKGKSKSGAPKPVNENDYYSDSVINNYASFLVNRAERLAEFPYENTNLYYYVDPTEFAEVQAAILKDPNYPEVNQKCISKGFGPSMDRYKEFLESLYSDEGDTEEEMVVNDSEKLKTCLEVSRDPRENTLHPLNFIIYGAPGTGKTYSTAEYALAIIENRPVDTSRKTPAERKEVMKKYNSLVSKGQIVFTTFHQSYGYEEFIQGLRPDTSSEHMSFKTVDGVFKHIADIALNDGDNNYVIIIDEINRANISKVFGELITLIEADKRWGEVNETCATLQSGDVFAVPNNLYIVGTMNSADKSISLIDAALRRRFEFIEQHPDKSLVDDPVLRGVMKKLNEQLADALESSDLLIGHSYFMGRDKDALCTIMNNSIIPLLYEYFYDNKKKVINVLEECMKGLDVEIKDDKISRVYVVKAEAEADA